MAVAVGLLDRALPLTLLAPLRLAILVGAGGLIYPALLWLLEKEAIAEVLRLVPAASGYQLSVVPPPPAISG